MDNTKILEKVCEIVAGVLRCDRHLLNDSTTAGDVDRWDSLANINILMSLEAAFGIRFALGEIQELKSIGEIVRLISGKHSQGA